MGKFKQDAKPPSPDKSPGESPPPERFWNSRHGRRDTNGQQHNFDKGDGRHLLTEKQEGPEGIPRELEPEDHRAAAAQRWRLFPDEPGGQAHQEIERGESRRASGARHTGCGFGKRWRGCPLLPQPCIRRGSRREQGRAVQKTTPGLTLGANLSYGMTSPQEQPEILCCPIASSSRMAAP